MANEETIQALFYIEPKTPRNRVQHIGCRLVLTEKLIHAGFTKGGVFNLPDGRVEVIMEGNRRDVETFYQEVKENLVTWLEEKTDNKERLKQMIGNPGIAVSSLEFKSGLLILDVGLFSHSLEMNQLEKGVDVYYTLMQAFRENSAAYQELMGAFKQNSEVFKQNSGIYGELKDTIKGLNRLLDEKLSKS
ncbi:MAG: acylphosphatase [Candidatus Micrarchaeota archaeon]|nr:acylphosphatase [Candidatus Micrarchaeota archaeon]